MEVTERIINYFYFTAETKKESEDLIVATRKDFIDQKILDIQTLTLITLKPHEETDSKSIEKARNTLNTTLKKDNILSKICRAVAKFFVYMLTFGKKKFQTRYEKVLGEAIKAKEDALSIHFAVVSMHTAVGVRKDLEKLSRESASFVIPENIAALSISDKEALLTRYTALNISTRLSALKSRISICLKQHREFTRTEFEKIERLYNTIREIARDIIKKEYAAMQNLCPALQNKIATAYKSTTTSNTEVRALVEEYNNIKYEARLNAIPRLIRIYNLRNGEEKIEMHNIELFAYKTSGELAIELHVLLNKEK